MGLWSFHGFSILRSSHFDFPRAQIALQAFMQVMFAFQETGEAGAVDREHSAVWAKVVLNLWTGLMIEDSFQDLEWLKSEQKVQRSKTSYSSFGPAIEVASKFHLVIFPWDPFDFLECAQMASPAELAAAIFSRCKDASGRHCRGGSKRWIRRQKPKTLTKTYQNHMP